MNSKKLLLIAGWNIAFLLLFMGAIELVLGNWLKPKPAASQIPNASYGKHLKWNAQEIYRSSTPVLISYTRDQQGYRNFNPVHRGNRILTIGGSTTDQRFVSDGETWQDELERLNPTSNVINGGVDGQSALGHLFAIKNWHAIELKDKQISKVVFYFGINDLRLLALQDTSSTSKEQSQAKAPTIKELISQNSFWLKTIRKSLSGHRLPPTSQNFLSKHGSAFESFLPLKKGEPQSITKEHQSSVYQEIIQQLALQSHQTFPTAEIIFVQQQIPGCHFLSPVKVIDRHPHTRGVNQRYCQQLGQVYLVQDQALRSLPGTWRPRVLKMYLKQYITDQGVYDAVHTNATGSKQIANYLDSNL